MNIYVFYTSGEPYEQIYEVRSFIQDNTMKPLDRLAQDWINEQIAKNPPGQFKVQMIVQGFELEAKPVEYLTRIEIERKK